MHAGTSFRADRFYRGRGAKYQNVRTSMSRISVIRNEQVVPLLPGKALNDSVLSPWSDLILEKHCIGAIEIPEHEHSSFCFQMQTSGPSQMEWWSEGKYRKESLGQGSLLLLTPGTRDRVRWFGSSRRVVLSIGESYMLRAAQGLGRKNPLRFQNRWAFEDRQLLSLLSAMQREMETGWEMGTLYGDHLGMLLAIALIQKYSRESSIAPLIKGGISKVRLRRVLEYIAANGHLDLRLDDLAKIAGMSQFHFARLFRLSMGVTPHRYLMDQRLQQAKALLRLDSRTMAEVAAEIGFANGGHFARAFKRHLGVSPTEWQRKS
jgi:AraC family transcriptional regulator